jgi:hypothetical protein
MFLPILVFEGVMRIRLLLIVLLASMGLAMMPMVFFPVQDKDQDSAQSGSDEGDDDPVARYQWEMMRTADPETGQLPYHIREKELAFAQTLPRHEDIYSSRASYKTGSAWASIGPWNIGGRTRAFAIDATNEKILLAGGVTGGMWRSTDAGKSWMRTSLPGDLKSVSCLTQDKRPGKTNIWYYGTGENIGGYVVTGDGFYKSADSGKTWHSYGASNKPQSLQPFDYIWNIAVNPANKTQDEVLMAAYGGIYRSVYGGDSMKLVLGGGSSLNGTSTATDIAITSTGVMYAVMSSDGPTTQRGVWRSTDGVHWVNILPSNGWPAKYGRMVIGIAPSNENIVYILGSTPGFGKKGLRYDGVADYNSFWKYTYLSGDGSGAGGNWEDRSNNLPAQFAQTGWIFSDFNSQGGYDLVIKVKPDDENVVFIGGMNLYRSDNGLADTSHTSWIGGYNHATNIAQEYNYPNHHSDQHNLVFLPSNYKVAYSTTDGGIFRTDDLLTKNVSWTPMNNGYMNSQFYSIAINQNPKFSHPYSDMILGGLQDNRTWSTGIHADAESPWKQWRGGDGGYCALLDGDTATYMFFSSQEGKTMMQCFDKNGNVLGWRRIDPIGGKGYLFVDPFVIDPNNRNTMYLAGGNYIWRNDSLGYIPLVNKNDSIRQGWARIDASYIQGATVTALGVSKAPANTLYYAAYNNGIYKLTNANATKPTLKNISNSKIKGYISCIAVDPDNGNHIIVVASNYNVRSLFYSADGGSTWQDISGNLETSTTGVGDGPSCRWAKFIHTPDGQTQYLVGTSVGLFFSDSLNANPEWVLEGGDQIGNTDVEMIDARTSDGLVLAATYGSGVFASNMSFLTGIRKQVQESDDLRMYPNPSTGFTTIEMSNSLKDAEVSVYTLQGKLVRHSVESGNRFTLNTEGLSRGVYLVNIRSGSQSISKKLLVE